MQQPSGTQPTRGRRTPAAIGWAAAVLLVIGAWAAAYAVRGGGPVTLDGWQEGISAGQDLAKEQDKPMVVLFTASWCGPCQQLKHDVLTRPEVDELLHAGFVPVKVDLSDQSSGNPNMRTAMRYHVESIPTVIAMTPAGERISTYRGDQTPRSFQAWLDSIQMPD